MLTFIIGESFSSINVLFLFAFIVESSPNNKQSDVTFRYKFHDKWLKPAITRELRHSRKFGRPTYASHWNKGQVNGSSETWICLLYSLSNQTSCTWIYEKGVNKNHTKKMKRRKKKSKREDNGKEDKELRESKGNEDSFLWIFTDIF